jgi:RND family efflux transporter MFP subunit
MIENLLKKWALGIVLVLSAGFLVVHVIRAIEMRRLNNLTAKEFAASPRVDVVKVEKLPAIISLRLPGEVEAWHESNIYSRVDGYVSHWSVDIGDKVTHGQVLAELDTPDLDAKLIAAKAQLKAAEALVLARKADAKFAQSTSQRWGNSPKGVVSEQERTAKKSDYDSATAKLAEAQAQVNIASAEVERCTVLSQFKQVTAPYDGTITRRTLDIGDLVTSGSTNATSALFRISQADQVRVFVNIPQSEANAIKSNIIAQITVSDLPGRIFKGKVTRTTKAINKESRTLRAEIDVPNADHLLLPGMYVKVNFQLPTIGIGQIPAAAIVFRGHGPEVAVVNKNNQVNFRHVTIVNDNGSLLEIGSGIHIGDKIVLNISDQIEEGQIVIAQDVQ